MRHNPARGIMAEVLKPWAASDAMAMWALPEADGLPERGERVASHMRRHTPSPLRNQECGRASIWQDSVAEAGAGRQTGAGGLLQGNGARCRTWTRARRVCR